MDWFLYDHGLRHERVRENYKKEKQIFNAEAKCLLILMLKSTSEQTLPEAATRVKSSLLFP